MSFDEKQYVDNDEIDLAELFRSIWFYKFSLLIIVILSVPLSIWYSTTLEPTYKAETVFEKPSDNSPQGSTSLLNNIRGMAVVSSLTGGSVGGENNNFLSEIRSESFLKTVILDNAELDTNMLKEFCPLPSTEVPPFSRRALLIALGVSENRVPSESQKISLLVRCVNNMLAIDFDNYGTTGIIKTSAYRLSIESGDPNFSANLANQIVEKYFVRHEKVKDQNFQNVKQYLSKVITEAQLELTEANKLMQNFKIKHTRLMDLKPSLSVSNGMVISNGMSIVTEESPFKSELNKEIASLSKLEKSLNQLKQARLNLSNLKELNEEKIKIFVSSTEVQGVFSRTFITAVTRLNNLSAGTSKINKEITKIVSQELQSLKKQIQVLEEKIIKREERTIKLMNIENRFQELGMDVSKKNLIFEGLKDQLKEKILSTGLANVEQPTLLTKAVPPLRQAFPNKKLIVILGAVLSILVGIACILISHFYLRRVHSLSQLRRLSKFLRCYEIKYKKLKQMSERSDETVIGQSFFSHTMGIGKLGCIIDLSQKRQNNSIVSEFSKTIANLLATDNSKIVCLDNSQSKKPFFSNAQQNSASDHSNHNVKAILNKNVSYFDDEDGIIGSGEIKKIENKYSDYDKIVCALGSDISDLTKFKFIEHCDFYILIGRSFHFDEYTYKKFSNTVWEKEKKCLGFFLIH